MLKHYHLFRKLKSSDWDIINENDELVFNNLTTQFNTEEWIEVMDHFVRLNMKYSRKCLITKNAYRLSQKIQKELDISVFPVVERVYLGSMHNEEGYATWKMYQSNMFAVGSNQPMKDFLLLRNRIFWLRDGSNDSFLYAGQK